jgi:hypothetical protein
MIIFLRWKKIIRLELNRCVNSFLYFFVINDSQFIYLNAFINFLIYALDFFNKKHI